MDVDRQRKGGAKSSELLKDSRKECEARSKQIASLGALPPTVNATTTSTTVTERDVNCATQCHLRKYDKDGALKSARYNQLSGNHD